MPSSTPSSRSWTHTDFDDPPRVFAEARRVRHPCFGSPFVAKDENGSPVAFRPGYRTAVWRHLPPDSEPDRISARVGIHHLPLADLLNAIAGSGFTIEHVEEPGDTDPPLCLALRARRPA